MTIRRGNERSGAAWSDMDSVHCGHHCIWRGLVGRWAVVGLH